MLYEPYVLIRNQHAALYTIRPASWQKVPLVLTGIN